MMIGIDGADYSHSYQLPVLGKIILKMISNQNQNHTYKN